MNKFCKRKLDTQNYNNDHGIRNQPPFGDNFFLTFFVIAYFLATTALCIISITLIFFVLKEIMHYMLGLPKY